MHSFTTKTLLVTSSIAAGIVAGIALAGATGPSEHKGLSVQALGKLDPAMIERQVGLGGHMMQLRAITIEPGGQIAQHGHEKRPGLVAVVSGEWVEGRPDGEAVYSSDSETGIIEDGDTTHWFYNRGDVPATAIVCDLNPV